MDQPYDDLSEDLDHLLMHSKIEAEAEYECERIEKAGKSLEKVVNYRRWLAQMQRYADEDAERYVQWMQDRLHPTQRLAENLSPDAQISEDKHERYKRIASHLNGGHA